ncbi:ROK family transcriptional regulator [Cohnella nanjingensis]|uniref:ROK family transcriptional regulator n=1 Tax=Cohnella nanjingensis TaxID=1387779 RepID=A0A7X0VHG6_9BACL|nr:ROK family transcriptional regulator [Cohnella nanjingensis]MBB6673463.1 ROK family transcriptional regulator [Cohnella nanjingensis]
MRKGNLELLKKINRDLVLETIRSQQPISRAKVAQRLNFSRSTVSSIVDELIAKKFVEETGLGSSTKEGGRRAIELGFNPRSGFGVGVELMANGLLICITDLDGNVVWKERSDAGNDFKTIYECILASLDKASISMDAVIAIGFCIPGLTDSKKGIVVDAPEFGWKDLPFVDEMKKYLAKPIYANNDVNCAALGERWIGGAKDLEDFIYIYIGLGSGVGSAIVANGNLVHGKDFMAGEIAYLIQEEDVSRNQVNVAGQFGVFEKKISGKSLAENDSSVQVLFQGYAQEEPRSVQKVNRFVTHLSIGIANMVSLLNPEKVILGGEVAEYLNPVLEEIRSNVGRMTPIQTTVEISRMGAEAGVLGVIAYAFDQEQNVI